MYFLKTYFCIMVIPFFNILWVANIVPWVTKVYVLAAPLYFFGILFSTLQYFLFIKPTIDKELYTLETFKQKLSEIRKIGPAPVNQPEKTGPLSLDPLRFEEIEKAMKKQYDETGETWFIVNLYDHEVGKEFLYARKGNRHYSYSLKGSYMRFSKFFYDRPSG
jgi:hypothetical protein